MDAAIPVSEGLTLDVSRAASRWSIWQLAGFRFVFGYFGLYCFPHPFDALPGLAFVDGPVNALWAWIVQFVGTHLLHLNAALLTVSAGNGSGDTTYSYVQVLASVLIAGCAAVVWSVLDRRRTNYDTLYRWARVYLRIWLAYWLLAYGLIKIFQLQFPAPGPFRLIEPYGDSSPMGILWAFMGASGPYQIFAGTMETLAGLMLLVPRLVTLGALTAFAVMTNVVMLNFAYDVPVKLFSTHLLLAALVLIAPNAYRLIAFLALGKTESLRDGNPVIAGRMWRRVWTGAQIAISASVLWAAISLPVQALGTDHPPLYGVYRVERGNTNWEEVGFDHYQLMGVTMADGTHKNYSYSLKGQHLDLRGHYGSRVVAAFTLKRIGADGLLLDGTMNGRTVHAALARSKAPFLLVTRGFHWISEAPYNR